MPRKSNTVMRTTLQTTAPRILLACAVACASAPSAFRADAAEVPIETHLRVPQAYADYVHDELLPAARARCRVVGLPPPDAYGYFDAGDLGMACAPCLPGALRQSSPLRDAYAYLAEGGDGDGQWDAGELVFRDEDGDGQYTVADTVLAGTAPPAPHLYSDLTTLNIGHMDLDGDGRCDAGEPLWTGRDGEDAWYGARAADIVAAATDWDALIWEGGAAAGPEIRYLDEDGNRRCDAGEPVFEDTGLNGRYDDGADPVLAGAAGPEQDGARGLSEGLFHFDADASGDYTTGDVLWFDATSLDVEASSVHGAVSALAPRFVVHQPALSASLADAELPSVWTVQALLDHIGDADRIPNPVSGGAIGDPRDLHAWMAQQRDLLNALVLVKVPNVDVQGNGETDIYEAVAKRIMAANGLDAEGGDQPPDWWDAPAAEPTAFLTFTELEGAVESVLAAYADESGGEYGGGADRPAMHADVPEETLLCADLFDFVVGLDRTLHEVSSFHRDGDEGGAGFHSHADVPTPGFAMRWLTTATDDNYPTVVDEAIGDWEQRWTSEWHVAESDGQPLGAYASYSFTYQDGDASMPSIMARTCFEGRIASLHLEGVSTAYGHSFDFFMRPSRIAAGSGDDGWTLLWPGTPAVNAYAFCSWPENTFSSIHTQADTTESSATTGVVSTVSEPGWPALIPWGDLGLDPNGDGFAENFGSASACQGFYVTDKFALVTWQFGDPATPGGAVTVELDTLSSPSHERTYHTYFERRGDPDSFVRVDQQTVAAATHSFTDSDHYLEDVATCVAYADFSAPNDPDYELDAVPEEEDCTPISADAFANGTPDVERDDLVEVGADLTCWGPDTGTMHFDVLRAAPQVLLPLGVEDRHCLPVHAYVAQSAGSDFENSWWHPPNQDEGAPLRLSYSLHTRARNVFFRSDDTERLKRVEVIRPRGNIAVFDFPWDPDEQEFEAFGRPIPLPNAPGNQWRSYVLVDTTPDDHGDLDYQLRFRSGIVHEFAHDDGAVERVRHLDGRQQSVSPRHCDGVAINAHFTHAVGPRYQVDLQWTDGLLEKAVYHSRLDPAKSVEATVGRDGDGLANELTKTVAGTAVPELGVSVAGVTITFGSGTTLERTGTSTVTFATTVPDAAPARIKEEIALNPKGFPTDRTRTLGTGPDATHAVWKWEYDDDDGCYPENGVGKWTKVRYAERPVPMGYWEGFEYDPQTGWLEKRVTPFKDAHAGDTAPHAGNWNQSACVVQQYFYSTHDGEPNAPSTDQYHARPTRIDTLTLGTRTARSYKAYGEGFDTTRVCRSADGNWSDEDNLQYTFTWNTYGPPDIAGPTGFATYDCSWNGPDSLNLQVVETTHLDERTTTVVNPFGGVESRETVFDPDGDALTVAEATASDVDAWGRPGRIDHLDGTHAEFLDYLWHGAPETVVERDCSQTVRTFTGDGRVETEARYGVTTTHTYDAAGNRVQTQLAEDSTTLTAKDARDAAGRTVQTKSLQAPAPTEIVYDQSARTLTVDPPEPGTLIQTHFRDGRLKQVSGDVAPPSTRNYGVDGGRLYSQICRQIDGDTTVLERAHYTPWGALHRRERADDGTSFAPVLTVTQHDHSGRPVRWRDADGAETSVVYNDRHRLASATASGVTVLFTDDYAVYEGKTVAHRRTEIGDTVRVRRVAVDGTRIWREVCGRLTKTTIQPQYTPATPGKRTLTTEHPDGTVTVREETEGLPQSLVAKDLGGTEIARTDVTHIDQLLQEVTAERNGKGATLRPGTGTVHSSLQRFGGGNSETVQRTTDHR